MAFAVKMTATVKDASNNPVSGVVVTFTAPSSGATGLFVNGTHVKTATTDVNGLATASVFTANNIAGAYTVTATASSASPANFLLTNKAGPAASITPTAGTPQSTARGTAFATKMTATVRDASNNPVSGV